MASPYGTAQNTATAHRPQTFKDVIGQETPKAALRAIAKAPATSFHSILLAGPFGTGKCVSGDTLIQTSKGIRQIRSLFPIPKGEDTKYTPPQPVTLHFGNTTLPVSYLYYSGVKPTIKVTTNSGKVLIGSYRHPVLTLNPETKRIEYIPLSLLTMKHHLIGVVANKAVIPNIRPLSLPLLYTDFISLPYAEQLGYVAYLVQMEGCLSLRTPSLMYAQAIAAVAAIMGCYSNIETISYPPDTGTSYLVNLIPLMENSILSRAVGAALCPYDLHLAKSCRGEIKFDVEYSYSEEAAEALGLTEKSVLYSDRIVSVEEGCPIPLYDLHVEKVHAFIGGGYINHNTTLAKVFAKAVNCSKHDGDACGECVHCITHSNPHEYDSSMVGRIDAIRSLREDLRSKSILGYRTVIFDEAQSCSREAQSALLTLVEEPPKDTFIIFCTTDADSLSEPLLSRCLRLDLTLMSSQQIEDRISHISKIKCKQLPDKVIRSIINKSRGHVRTCDNLLDMYLLDGVESGMIYKTMAPTFFNMLVSATQGDSVKFNELLDQTIQVPLALLRDDYFAFLEELSAHFIRVNPQLSHVRKSIPMWLRLSLAPLCAHAFTDERLMMTFFRFLYHNIAPPPPDETRKEGR